MARTANPPAGQKLPFPNHKSTVDQVVKDNPTYLKDSCQDQGGNWHFMDEVLRRLRAIDTRYGNNGKRGDANNPSHDVIAYNYSDEPDEGTTKVYIIDIILGHCGPDPKAAWIDQTKVTADAGTIGRWCLRENVSEPGGGGGEVPPTGGVEVSKEEIQKMIDASLNAAMQNVPKYDEKVALQADGGKLICAESGGPKQDGKPFELTSRTDVGPWESFKLRKGQ